MHTNSLLISGYRHTDLGIFNDKDPRIPIIKTAIKKSMTQFLEDGVEWFIFTRVYQLKNEKSSLNAVKSTFRGLF
ncbi:DUF1273 family protein [Streptococcus suis]|nr:DUF1273 family protein [Streptococcus suis]